MKRLLLARCYAGCVVDMDGRWIIPVCFCDKTTLARCNAGRLDDMGGGWIISDYFCDKTTVGELLCWPCGRQGWRMDYFGLFL